LPTNKLNFFQSNLVIYDFEAPGEHKAQKVTNDFSRFLAISCFIQNGFRPRESYLPANRKRAFVSERHFNKSPKDAIKLAAKQTELKSMLQV